MEAVTFEVAFLQHQYDAFAEVDPLRFGRVAASIAGSGAGRRYLDDWKQLAMTKYFMSAA